MKAAPISIMGESVQKITNPGRKEDFFVFGRYASIWLNTDSLTWGLSDNLKSSVNVNPSPMKSKASPQQKSSTKKRNPGTTFSPAPTLINNSRSTQSASGKNVQRWAEDSDSSEESEEEWEKDFEEEETYMQEWGSYTARVDQNGVKVLSSFVLFELVS